MNLSVNKLVIAVFPKEMPPKIAAAIGILKGVIVSIEAPHSIHDKEIPVIFNAVFAHDHFFLIFL